MSDLDDIDRTKIFSSGRVVKRHLAWINRHFEEGFTLTDIAQHLAAHYRIDLSVQSLSKAYKRATGKTIREAHAIGQKVPSTGTPRVAEFGKNSDTSTLSHLATSKQLVADLASRKSPKSGS